MGLQKIKMNKKVVAAAGAALLLVIMQNKEAVVTATLTQYDSLFKKYGAQYGVDWTILKRICYIESTLGANPRVLRGILNPNDVEGSKSSDGKSWGIMQLRPSTAQQFDPSATPQKLNNPEYSVKIAAQYVAWCQGYVARNIVSRSSGAFLEWVIKSYNEGVGNADKEQEGKIEGYADAYWEKFKKVVV